MLENPIAQCRHGGRVLGASGKDGQVRELDRWNGYSIRPLAYWAETGEYPSKPIRRCDDRVGCIDCGRFVFDDEPAPEPEVIPSPPPVPVVPPAQPAVADAAPVVERVERGRVPQGELVLVPRVVPGPVPASFQLPGWLWRLTLGLVVVLVVGVAMTVAVQGVSFGVSTVVESVPSVDVDYGTSTSTTGL